MSQNTVNADAIQSLNDTPTQQGAVVNSSVYVMWPVHAYGGAYQPYAQGAQWTALISAGGQNDAVVCHAPSREMVLGLREHILRSDENKFLIKAMEEIKVENDVSGDSDRTSALIAKLLAEHKTRFRIGSGV